MSLYSMMCQHVDNNESVLLLIKVKCRRCGTVFYVCRSCWRGQAYCSDKCRKANQREAHAEAQRRYRQTARGKKNIKKMNVDEEWAWLKKAWMIQVQ